MCVQCMIAAMSSSTVATGTRAWLARHHFAWLTPVRMKRITIALIALGLVASTLFASGSGGAAQT
jgi:hypothetical protein